jgi:hypothetical protein
MVLIAYNYVEMAIVIYFVKLFFLHKTFQNAQFQFCGRNTTPNYYPVEMAIDYNVVEE